MSQSHSKAPSRATLASAVIGIGLGLTLAMVHLAGTSAVARDPGVVTYEIDLSRDLTADDVAALMAFAEAHPGRDIILQPVGDIAVVSGTERRQRDAARAAREDAARGAAIEQGVADGHYVVDATARPACHEAASRSRDEPARFLLCDGVTVSAPSLVAERRVTSRSDAEQVLDERLRDVLRGVTSGEEAMGFSSNFANDAVLERVTLSREGRVIVDFNDSMREALVGVHPGSASHYMLEQLFKTLFQFRDVASVELTLGGSCDAFGALIEGPCQAIDRGLWEHINELNQQSIDYFTLQGGRS